MRQHLPDMSGSDGAIDFLFGVIFNQRVRSEVAWRAPQSLRRRLGELDVNALADMDVHDLATIVARPPALHPFARSMARNIVGTSRHLLENYQREASRIWSGEVDGDQLIRRLVEFPGVGSHKAEVALFLLVFEYGIPITEGDARYQSTLDRCPRLAELYMN